MAYEISIDNFQGPLELLYQLIKKNRIEISEISLARITGQYLTYLQRLNQIDLETCSEFTLIAVELIELKARELLPEEEKESREKNSRPLVERLKEYRQFRELADFLHQCEEDALRIYGHPVEEIDQENSSSPEIEITIDHKELAEIYLRVIQAETEDNRDQIQPDKMEFISEESIRIQDKIGEITDNLKNNNGRLSFEQLLNNGNNPLEIVVTLLSILELARMQEITIKQQGLYRGINIIQI